MNDKLNTCDHLDGMSLDIEATEREKLRSLFPQCFSEGKLDIDKLLNLCGEYIDEDFEKYKFEWKGKAECFRIAGKRSTGTLRPCAEESVNFDTTQNVYIEGDNLEVLKLLQTSYFRKVKMIYIDPPYNTGNDFVYADDFKDPMARYKEVTQQTTKSNPETMGRFHTNWLNMMYPRLRLAANLLRDDGVIFISIDDNEVHNLRKLCDEVFGEENFVGDYIKQSKVGGGSDSKYIVKEHEYCLCYAKSINNLPEMFIEHDTDYLKRYSEEDETGRYFWDTFARPGLKNPIIYDIKAPDGTIINNGWIRSKERFEKEYRDGIIRIFKKPNGEWSVQFKQYLNEGGKKPRSMTMDFGGTIEGKNEIIKLFNNDRIFSYPKSPTFVKQLVKTVSNTNNNDIILDFFSGSATTAHAVMRLNAEDGGNRKFIMIQLPEVTDEKSEAYKAGYKNICEIGKERIRRAGVKVSEKLVVSSEKLKLKTTNSSLLTTNLDVGFKVFKLDTSNLVTWDAAPISDENLQTLWDRFDVLANTIKADRSDMDIIFEVMLKMGVPLDYPVLPITVNNKKAYSIGKDCMLLVCLDCGITPEDIEAMCELAPFKIIAAEAGFADDTALSNAHYILRDKEIEMKLL